MTRIPKPWGVFDDAGSLQHHKHIGNDCVARAIAIAADMPYLDVAALIKVEAAKERRGSRKRGTSTVRSGVYGPTTRRVLAGLGWTWHPTMQIGAGCTVHLRADELPGGRLVVLLSKHLTAVIDGVIHDTHDPSRDGTRCVYGYWTAPEVKP